MGRQKITLSVKICVIRQYLEGLLRHHIAQINNIATGSVSNIIYEYEEDIPDIYILREVAVKLIGENIDINDIAASIRLKNKLNRLELTEENIEFMMERFFEFYFKTFVINLNRLIPL